jgi:hypothetical protein
MLAGLPNSQAMGWEYQEMYRDNVIGMNIDFFGHDIVAALGANHRKDILTAATVVPYGNGRIILTTLRILRELGSDKPQSAVAKKLFLNFMEVK